MTFTITITPPRLNLWHSKKDHCIIWSERRDRHVPGIFKYEKLNQSIRIHFFRHVVIANWQYPRISVHRAGKNSFIQS